MISIITVCDSQFVLEDLDLLVLQQDLGSLLDLGPLYPLLSQANWALEDRVNLASLHFDKIEISNNEDDYSRM